MIRTKKETKPDSKNLNIQIYLKKIVTTKKRIIYQTTM